MINMPIFSVLIVKIHMSSIFICKMRFTVPMTLIIISAIVKDIGMSFNSYIFFKATFVFPICPYAFFPFFYSPFFLFLFFLWLCIFNYFCLITIFKCKFIFIVLFRSLLFLILLIFFRSWSRNMITFFFL